MGSIGGCENLPPPQICPPFEAASAPYWGCEGYWPAMEHMGSIAGCENLHEADRHFAPYLHLCEFEFEFEFE